MTEVTIENVGPITDLTIPIPDEGGVVVLRGRNGRGKSHALEAVEALASGKRLSVADGQSSAYVGGLGARLTVGRRTSKTGDLEVRLLEGEDPSILVDPGLRDVAAADKRRIEAILRLAGAVASIDLFAGLVDLEELHKVASPESLAASNVPDMAARLKRDFERAARQREAQAENLTGVVDTLRAQFKGVDMGVPHDPAQLAEEHRTAVVDAAREEERQNAARKALDAAARAREAMESRGRRIRRADG